MHAPLDPMHQVPEHAAPNGGDATTAFPEDACPARILHPDRIKTARKKALPDGEYTRLGQLFRAMADPTRLRLLWAMAEEEICVCDLAALLGVSQSAVSHQLRLLRTLGLVKNRREGAVLHYRLADHHVQQLITLALEHVRE